MNLDHLGDTLGLWKGSIIRLLKNENALVNLHVLPMLTDPKRWAPDQLSVYARSLNVEAGAVLNRTGRMFPKEDREEYFRVDPQYDLFIDPDTGVKIEEYFSQKHITVNEILGLVPEGSTRMLMIYQYGGRRWGEEPGSIEKAEEYVQEVIAILKEKVGTHCAFAYSCGQVSIIFVSRDSKRLERVASHLKRLLELISSKRLIGDANGST